jgi:MFS family permease
VASLACGLATSIGMLVVLRSVQALGAGAFMPSATGIVSDFFGRDRDRAIGFFTSIFPIGGIIGPILGGLIVTYWSWRIIFLINVPLGVLLLVLGAALLPRSQRKPAQRFDLTGIALLLSGLLAAMLGITLLGDSGVDRVAVVLPLLAAGGAFGAYTRHALRHEDAVIPMRFLRGRGFGIIHLVNLLSGAATLGFGALIPLYAEDRYGLSPLSAGTLLTARAVGMIAVASGAAVLLRHTGYRMPMIVGNAIIALGLVLTALAPPFGLGTYSWLSFASAVAGLGMGISIPASNNAALHLVPDNAAAMSGIRGMFRQAGGITSISVVTALSAQAADPGQVQAVTFVIFAGLLLLLIPLITRTPDHRGSW